MGGQDPEIDKNYDRERLKTVEQNSGSGRPPDAYDPPSAPDATYTEVYDAEWLRSLLEHGDLRLLSDNDEARLRSWIASFQRREAPSSPTANMRTDLIEILISELHQAGIFEGRIAELGGPFNSFEAELPEYEFHYLSLYPVEGRPEVHVYDITQDCGLPDASFDAIISTSVLEHVSKPWEAANQITRLLRVGGLSFHSAPFSYFYHGAPADYWRYTPDAFMTLFSSLRPTRAEFYSASRRRDNRGSEANAVDRDGGSAFAVDALGGWRENWFAIYAGIKDPAYLADKLVSSERQVLVNLMKNLVASGVAPGEAAREVSRVLLGLQVNQDAEISKGTPGTGMRYTPDQVIEIWERRSKKTVMPSYSRFVMGQISGIGTGL